MTDSTVRMNNIGIIIANIGADRPHAVLGNIICDNTASGLTLGDSETVDAQGNWWGSVTGPFHAVNNPTGTGNAVVDGTSGGGSGTVDFSPWIDTVTVAEDPTAITGQPEPIRFQFSGGNGTVFLGDPTGLVNLIPGNSGPPGAVPPFTITTDNGVLKDHDETAAEVHEFITDPEFGIVEVFLQAAHAGSATVVLTGPCGLASRVALDVVRNRPAPALGGIGLALLAGALGIGGAALLRRRARG